MPDIRRLVIKDVQARYGLSERRTCRIFSWSRSSQRYHAKEHSEELRLRMKELSLERRRFGYRRLHILLKREGYHVNHKKLYRLYKESGLQVRARHGRKRAIGSRHSLGYAACPNEVWSLDFVSDRLADGRKFRVLIYP